MPYTFNVMDRLTTHIFSRAGEPMPLEVIERQLDHGFPFSKFEPALEQAYEAAGLEKRLKDLRYCVAIGVIVYNLFLISDWKMIPDVFYTACFYRLGIFTPLVLAALCFIQLYPNRLVREGISIIVSLVSVSLVVKLNTESNSVYIPTYNSGSVLIMIYMIVLQRPPVRYAFLFCIGCTMIQWFGTQFMAGFNSELRESNALLFITAAIMLLLSAYKFEMADRLAYLLALRGTCLNNRLDEISRIDPLTGLWNRRQLNETMKAAWTVAQRHPKSMAAVIADIDHFKSFNDTAGHPAGDLCLQRVANALRQGLGPDLHAPTRFGGEEFVIFLPGFALEDACNVAENLRAAIRDEAISHPAGQGTGVVTASFGVAAGLTNEISAPVLLSLADKALYRAKAEGRNCIRVTSSDSKIVLPIAATTEEVAIRVC